MILTVDFAPNCCTRRGKNSSQRATEGNGETGRGEVTTRVTTGDRVADELIDKPSGVLLKGEAEAPATGGRLRGSPGLSSPAPARAYSRSSQIRPSRAVASVVQNRPDRTIAPSRFRSHLGIGHNGLVREVLVELSGGEGVIRRDDGRFE